MCDIASAETPEDLDALGFVATPARMEPGEQAVACFSAVQQLWKPTHASAYQRGEMWAFGSLGFIIGAHVVNEIVNSSNKKRAAREAAGQWITQGSGPLTITTFGAHFTHTQAWATIPWLSVEAVNLPTFDRVEIQANMGTGGRLGYSFNTPWAPLVFILAAFVVQPSHPLLHNHGWVPPYFAHLRPGVPVRVALHAANRARQLAAAPPAG